MYEINFKDWKEFKSAIVQKLENASNVSVNNFLFRGQADSNWQLRSSFDRIEKNKSKYSALIENFKNICINYNFNDELFSRNDDKAIAAYAQHYGLPTRLLDWTLSPYFAAFFAFSTANSIKQPIKRCSVWAINKDSQALRQRGGIDFVSLPSNKFNYRMKNQIGHFTLSNHTEDSIEDFDLSLQKFTQENDLLWKCNIPLPTNISTILIDLELMGITYSTVYPDIQGYIEEAMHKSNINK